MEKQQIIDACDPVNRRLLLEGEQFLIREAELLDRGQYGDWIGLLAADIRYQIPIRITRERHAASPFSDQAWHMNENMGSIAMRVERTFSDYNWAEDPPSRTRHFLTNFRLSEAVDRGGEQEIVVRSNLLLFRSRFDSPAYELVSGEREDTLRRTSDGWRLAKRIVWLDHTTMGISSLGIFL
ncbi:aromatic-ring-hydroxylating dioxygenase subunit beta [Paenibacillus rhizovicinus]|uniref:Aromatic-ring-hydroxylating dioxygenase subunit beta n=1 Tax=Paenibacillus rhizovicinus TaxID=2704463 RepID=A0A6C0P739_9BACL|nr:aromatic-ring-hydroxylating dioxygenase subunit beta [Paenibacillus rhizovicinus]QHW34338.1 aromatic-ring-hydroxylating dioxygenase subunit beta [Paenibacillus rhizovicinus]